MLGRYELDVTAREDVPRWLAYGTPVFTVLAALTVSALALVALGVNPVAAYGVMFGETVTTNFGISQTLIRAVPLVLTGLAVYLPLRAGLWNIGAEGQLYLGAIAGTWIGLNVSAPSVVLLPLMLLGAGVAGGLWGLIPGLLRARRGINEIIVTLMLTFVGTELAGYLVRGPMRGGAGNFPVSEMLPAGAQLPSLGSVHLGVIVALLAAVAIRILVGRTTTGYEVTVTGSNADAAEHAGVNVEWVYVFVLVVGGMLAGLAGAIEIMGVQTRLRAGFSPGYGFTAIPIALLGRRGALRVVLAGLFFAVLFVGGSSMELAFGVPAALVEVIQALVILFLITAEFFKRYRIDVVRTDTGDSAGGVTAPGGD
jgi:simple sugar transport system permease protein